MAIMPFGKFIAQTVDKRDVVLTKDLLYGIIKP